MKIPFRLKYFFKIPPLWIIQIGKDELIFSRIIKNTVTEEETLLLQSNTILLNKVANSSSLQNALNLFCSKKKLSRIRAWILMPKELYPEELLPHELFQFLVSIKKTPVIPEKILSSPLKTASPITPGALLTLKNSSNHLLMFDRYTKLHPGWWMSVTIALAIFSTKTTDLITDFLFAKNHKHPLIQQQAPRSKALTGKKRVTQKNTFSKTSCSQLNFINAILTTSGSVIPPNIVLKKITAPYSSQKDNCISIVGVSTDIESILDYTNQLNEKLSNSCNLTQIRKFFINAADNKKNTPVYNFSLTINYDKLKRLKI